ncbi:MAG: PfkB family carbohydrate kinase [Candidatus Ventricola sp.]
MTALLLGDLTGRSRVALRMLTAALEARGHDVLMLPTALISNTLNLGRCAALDTTDYLLDALRVWRELGIRCDIASIGYITGTRQATVLCGVADALRAAGVRVILDPILGDNGKRYGSITDDQLAGMRLLMAHADLITPNRTEACLLSDIPMDAEADEELARRLAGRERSVLITGGRTRAGEDAVLGFDAQSRELFTVRYDRVPGAFFGTGDLFTALLMDGLLAGKTIRESAADACAHIARQLRGEEARLIPTA